MSDFIEDLLRDQDKYRKLIQDYDRLHYTHEDMKLKYETALRQIVDSEDQTMSYPDDMYFRAVAIARKALDP